MEEKTVYICDNCGHKEPKWTGRCPECGTWNSFSESKVTKKPVKLSKAQETKIAPVTLADCDTTENSRIFSGIEEIDRVLGGGIMRGSSIMIGGEPGIGKSTLMLQTAALIAENYKALYISGEESAAQIKQRSDRLGIKSNRLEILCETNLDNVMTVLAKGKYDFVVLDSIQTMTSAEVGNTPGTPNQLKYCCGTLTDWAKLYGKVVMMIAHVTKDGIIAGPKTVEHMVDTVLYFESSSTDLRIVRAAKNRFGSIDEFGLFQMRQEGLVQIKNPETVFLNKRTGGEVPPGVSIAPVFEGTRVFLVEIQALTVPAKSGISRIFSDKIDSSVISRVSAILEKHCRLKFSDHDIYVNVAGGIRIRDVGAELPIALTLYSARTGIPIPADIIASGELSLTGEVLKVNNLQGREKSASDFGFKNFVAPSKIRTIAEGIKAVFGSATSRAPEDTGTQ
ncbi:MAG: DNA repair protein RadA [Spirochaetia bacterium]|nr:DNA repair protein RadA [Spirochaetia bacterium]MBQ6673395.1 DNA repair protein RadA [Spirochaetia bacterium]